MREEFTYNSKYPSSGWSLDPIIYDDGDTLFRINSRDRVEASVLLNRETVARMVADLIAAYDFKVRILPGHPEVIIPKRPDTVIVR
jgi:hypothetical protein